MTGLQELANEAAAHWHGTITRLISHRENAVFEIALTSGRAALRLHRQGYQNDRAIRSELWWCAAMAETGVAVPQPIAAHNGSLLIALSNGSFASVISWISGAALGVGGVPFERPVKTIIKQHHDLGCLLASVHTATDRLVLPADFSRPRWDVAGLVGENPLWGRFWEHPVATPEQSVILKNARHFLKEKLSQHAANGGDFGPIHADVLRENVIVNDDSLCLIDFDDSGFGFRLYDLGTVMVQNLYEPAYLQIRDALISGYAETRVVTADLVEIFTLVRTCASVGWTIPRLASDDPIHHSHIARAVMWAEHVLAKR